jgi:hypothetical protein
MSNKYSHEEGVKKFYYSPDSHYCAIIAKDRKHVKEIRHKVLDHYLGSHHEYHQAEFIDHGKGKPVGELIHVKADIAAFLIGETQLGDIKIEISPVTFEDPKLRKANLQQLVN